MQLPVKIVVFNNGALSFVELEMKAGGIPTYGTELDVSIRKSRGEHAGARRDRFSVVTP